MIRTEFARWHFQHDPGVTRAAYLAIAANPEPRCRCDSCRNFWALGAEAFPPRMLKLFAELGIDLAHPAEVFHNAKLTTGLHSYGGWYHFVGDLDSRREGWSQTGPATWASDFEDIDNHFAVGLSRKGDLVAAALREYAVIQLDFAAELPWVITDPEPD